MRIIKTKLSLLCALIAAPLYSPLVSADINDPSNNTGVHLLSFEDKKLTGFKAETGGSISQSDKRAKMDNHSLLWKFNSGSKLVLNKTVNTQPQGLNAKSKAKSTFVSWLYNESAIDSPLTVTLYDGDKVKKQFDIGLNFTGWRSVAVPLIDNQNKHSFKQYTRLEISAPNQQGQIYFDQMSLNIPVDPRWPTPDPQTPYVNPTIAKRANAHWGALNVYDQWFTQNSDTTVSTNKDAEQQVKRIIKRIDKDLLSEVGKVSDKQAKKLLTKSKKLTRDSNDELKPVQMWRQLEIYYRARLHKDRLAAMEKENVRFHKYGKNLLALAEGFRKTKNKKQKNNLKQEFLLLTEHLIDQGFAYQSGVGIMHHQGYAMREWAKAFYLMRSHLGDLKQPSQQVIGWLTGVGRIYKPQQDIRGFNVDVMNTFLPGMLMSILMIDDKNERLHHLTTMSNWMSYSMLAIKGLSGGIQTDGSFFHHAQHYVAYGNGGLKGLSPVVYYLSHTPFALSNDAYQRLKHAVLMTRVFSNGLKTPMSLAGRHPEEYTTINLSPFKYLTLMGDTDIAKAYLRLMALDKEQLAKSPLEPEATPNGSWVMNYSSMTLHRQDEWLASARGFSKYLVGNETYRNANHYGRYINYGHVEILPSSSIDSGFSEPGWDWNRWSGTTAVHLPFDKLAADIGQVDEFSGVEEMLLSTESFSGGNKLNNNTAMFAMKLRGHDKYNSDLTANKSVFFFENRIVALGSDINNSDQQHMTETTLFQQHLADASLPSQVNNASYQGLDTNQLFNGDNFHLITDTRNNSYYVPGKQQLRLLRQNQSSFENEKKKPTQGDFVTAVLEHGKAPKNQQYEYAILVNTEHQTAHQLAKQQANTQALYQVISNTDKLHIVQDTKTNTTAFSVFSANDRINHSLLKAVDEPLMLMSEFADNQLNLAVTVPDLNLYQGKDPQQFDANGKQIEKSIYSRKWAYQNPDVKQATLTLSGQWQGKGENYHTEIVGETTKLTVNSYAAEPIQVQLTKTK